MVASLLVDDELLEGDVVLEMANRGITALDSLGCVEGDVIAVMLRNDPAYLVAMLMCRLGGFYACPINWHFKAGEAGYVLSDCGARVLIVHADLLYQIEGAIPTGVTRIVVEPSAALRGSFALDPDSCRPPTKVLEWQSWLARHEPYAGSFRQPRTTLPYSSGTTGRPKGIKRQPLSAEHASRLAEVCRMALGIEPGMRTAAVAPLYHSAPTLHGIQSMLAGELISIHPRFDGERLLAEIEHLRLTELYLVPTLFVRMLRLPEQIKSRYDLSSLKFVACTGAPCSPQVKEAMIAWWGPIITETYASSEAGLVTWCSSQDALERPGTAGRPLPGASVKILDEKSQELPAGYVGRIFTRQQAYPQFTYLNNDAARREIEHDGYICVGDLGYVDADGYLFVRDRQSDMVISGGVNIYPVEIESVLIQIPGVEDCAVFGVPDAEYGESLAAHIQLVPGSSVTREAVRAFLSTRLAAYKVPRILEFTNQLPREETGKVFKRKLRDPYWREAGRQI